MMRNYQTPNARLFRANLPAYRFQRGTTGTFAESLKWLPSLIGGLDCRIFGRSAAVVQNENSCGECDWTSSKEVH